MPSVFLSELTSGQLWSFWMKSPLKFSTIFFIWAPIFVQSNLWHQQQQHQHLKAVTCKCLPCWILTFFFTSNKKWKATLTPWILYFRFIILWGDTLPACSVCIPWQHSAAPVRRSLCLLQFDHEVICPCLFCKSDFTEWSSLCGCVVTHRCVCRENLQPLCTKTLTRSNRIWTLWHKECLIFCLLIFLASKSIFFKCLRYEQFSSWSFKSSVWHKKVPLIFFFNFFYLDDF